MEDMELNDKTALVTGGASGIGLAIATELAQAGCRVAICDRDHQRLEQATAGAGQRLLARACDVTDRADVAGLFAWFDEQFGRLAILVNCAGVQVARRSMAELDPADWDRLLAVNATGAYNCIHAALPGMRQRRDGLIVNIVSTAGKRAMRLTGPAYCASKFALAGLGLSVGLEERTHGIRVTNIYPGEVNTPILANRPEPVSAERKAQMLQPEEVAACVLCVAKLPPRAMVPELIVVPLYQDYA
jgi:NAD(P)-dependent dehydrogenase (short-subunit alcohol dehydrogenase family)